MERYDGKTEEQIEKRNRILTYLSAIAVVIAIAAIIVFTMSGGEYGGETLNIVFAFEGTLSQEARDLFESAVAQEDIEVNVEYMLFDPTTDEASFNALMLKASVDDYFLFILSDQPKPMVMGYFDGLSTVFCRAEYFDGLDAYGENYGFNPDGEYPNRVQVNNTPLFEEMGLGDIPFYASVVDWSTVNPRVGYSFVLNGAMRALQAIFR